MARVDGLPLRKRQILQTASVIGGTLPPRRARRRDRRATRVSRRISKTLARRRVPGAVRPPAGRGVRLQASADPGGHLRRAAARAPRGAAPHGRRGDRASAAAATCRATRACSPITSARAATLERAEEFLFRAGRRGGARRRVERGAALLRGGLEALSRAARRGRRSREARAAREQHRAGALLPRALRRRDRALRPRAGAARRSRRRGRTCASALRFARNLAAVLAAALRSAAGDRARRPRRSASARSWRSATRAPRRPSTALPTRHLFDSMDATRAAAAHRSGQRPALRRCSTPAARRSSPSAASRST